MKKFKQIPAFRNEKEERKFWATHDSSEYIDWKQVEKVAFPNLKPTTKSISIRLPESLLHRVKSEANANDVPYQSYIKMLIQRGLSKS